MTAAVASSPTMLPDREAAGMHGIAAVLTILYVASQAFDSALRWILEIGHAGAAIYVRDYLLVIAILSCLYNIARERQGVLHVFWLLWSLALGVCVALFSGLGLLQIAFGIKVWLPCVLGFLLVESKAVPSLHRPHLWLGLWLLVCIGVYINYFVRLPWTGLTLQVGGVEVAGNREWTAAGVKRLSGFSRTSYDAAIIILLLHVYLVSLWRHFAVRCVLILMSGAAIALTTTKGAAGAFLLATAFMPLLGVVSPSMVGPRRAILTGLVVLIALVGLLAPLMSTQIPLPKLREGSIEHWLFSSLVSRAWDTWPRALDLLGSEWQAFAGRGLGGIGAAQYTFEPFRANPADNLFVYLYVTAGVVGLAWYFYLAVSVRKLALEHPLHQAVFLVLLSLFTYGLTVNVVESAAFALVVGGVYAQLLSLNRGPAHAAGT